MSWIDVLTESTAALAPSGNPLEILPPRERAVLVLLGSGLDATTVAKLLHVSRRLPAQVFLNFKNPDVRQRYERDIQAVRSDASPEEIAAGCPPAPAECGSRRGDTSSADVS